MDAVFDEMPVVDDEGGKDEAEAMKSWELVVLCKGYYGAVWLITQKGLSKFGYAKVGAMPKQGQKKMCLVRGQDEVWQCQN